MESTIKEMCRLFRIPGNFRGYVEIKSGNVNTTYRVFYTKEDGGEKSYILQKLNTYAFKKPEELMENVDLVTEYIHQKYPTKKTLHFHHTLSEGNTKRKNFVFADDGTFWRLFNYIDSITYDFTDDLKIVRSAGKAFGEFQMSLADFDAASLHYTIPDFHNTVKRYETLENDIKADKAGRASSVKSEIEWLMSVRDKACLLSTMLENGELPLRVTHNDTKINNVLFDKETHEAISVIDLDTVMPGLVGHDFGDAIRFAANKCEEDCKDASKAGINMDVFKSFSEGFLSETAHVLTKNEIDTLALSPFVLACELATRFLDDYLNGDQYFRVLYPEHNIVRTRCQIALAKDMLSHIDEMNGIIQSLTSK